jgi:ribosomal protein S18 acetylase RimI-like enzyme
MSKDFKSQILINYTLFTRLTDTPIVRPDCVVALNPNNRDHQQGNMCFNIQLGPNDNVATLTQSVNPLFQQVGCQPRYHIDCFAGPSIDTLCDEFKALGYKVERDLDIVMSCDYKSLQRDKIPQDYRRARLDDLEALVRIFFEANHYPGTDDWLRKKLSKQMNDGASFPMFVMEQEGEVVCAVVLFTPAGLPQLGHVSGVATLPDHQRKGLAAACLRQALAETCKPDQRFYLDSYDDLVHAHRMYERVGFQSHGFMETAVATLHQ